MVNYAGYGEIFCLWMNNKIMNGSKKNKPFFFTFGQNTICFTEDNLDMVNTKKIVRKPRAALMTVMFTL